MATRLLPAKLRNVRIFNIEPVELLWTWLREGWRYRLGQGNQRLHTHQAEYLDQLNREMELIISKDFVSYFLLVSDIVRWAKDHEIAVGPGRGSSAASLVCYLLRITEPDPLQFPLTDFTRFIDPTRTDLPDIDIDFDDIRRHEVREYAVQRWGSDCVANIVTFTKYKGKNSLDDVGRVFEIPLWALEVVKGMIIERSGGDSRADASLLDTFASFPPAAAVLDLYPKLQMAIALEGNYRGMSTHAAGLVISDTPIADVCAMYTREDKSTGQLLSGVSVNKYDAEYLGLMKVDALGLTTMGEIAGMLTLTGMSLEQLYSLPFDDKMTFDAFSRADVIGVFQYEGRATRLVCREVQPADIYELIHVNALSRPGPLFSGTTTEFINIKRGLMAVPSIHPILDRIAAPTRGQIIYQEQVLHALGEFGGLPIGRVHDIRRIISQKLGEAQFNASSEDFITTAMKLNGVSRDVAAKVWERVVTSASYAFVYSHSLCYSIIGYWCQWFKQHYPTEFYQVKLGRTPDKQLPRLVQDAERHNVRVKGVTLGQSQIGWSSPRSGELVAGYETLPGVGPVMGPKIAEAERERGGFSQVEELLVVSGIGPKTLEKMRPLINVDDPFGLRRLREDMERVRAWIPTVGLPRPTYNSDALLEVSEVDAVFLGKVLERNYQDYVENKRARYGTEVKEILRDMKRPDLKTSVVLRCVDDGDEDVYVRINRYDFPRLKSRIDGLVVGRDMVLVRGRKSDRVAAFGISLQTKWFMPIDPND
jgi:DNA polymerase-3 subunit alpha